MGKSSYHEGVCTQFLPKVKLVSDQRVHLVRLAALKKMYPDMYLNMFNENAVDNQPKQIVYFGPKSVDNDDDMCVEICGQGQVDRILLSEFLGLRRVPGSPPNQVCFVALPEIPFQLDDVSGTILLVPGHGMCKVMSVGLVVSTAHRSLVECNFYVVTNHRQFLQASYTVNRKVNCSLRALHAITTKVV